MTDVVAGDVVGTQIRRGLSQLARLDGFSAALGGPVTHGGSRLVLSELHGMRTDQLRGVVIKPGIGLGGRVLERHRPVAVEDYLGAETITHQFDRAVVADSVRSALAFPVRVRGQIRAVMYGVERTCVAFGERTLELAMSISRQLAHNLLVDEEVDRRIALERQKAEQMAGRQAGAAELSEMHAELISIASAVTDPALRDRLLGLSSRLAGEPARLSARQEIPLSRRELDVVAQVAAGYTNAEVAERLSILPTTVKTHLSNAMRKLGARNRTETVAAARYAGLLP